jgi:hypothetical protein
LAFRFADEETKMTTQLDVSALDDPAVLITEFCAAGVGLTLDQFDQFDVLDPGRLLAKIDAAFAGQGIMDRWSLTDNPALAIARINAALSQLPT